MYKLNTEIESQVNELFAKTKIVQKFSNISENPLELKIYIQKKKEVIFSEFYAKIGNSIKVKSKVIKKEKAEEKYTDSIASGNSAIYVCEDPKNENILMVNMGNIPPKEVLEFTSEYIQLTEFSKSYEFELYRNLPAFLGQYSNKYHTTDFKGKIQIITNDKIKYVKVYDDDYRIKILEEKYLNEYNNMYMISYGINSLNPNLSYLPSLKVYFEVENNKSIIYLQKSTLFQNENNYIFQNIINNEINDNETYPGLYIFLIDQSTSMIGNSILMARKSLELFLHSLPEGSYYQLIGFGTNFIKYDEIPIEYNPENVNKSIKLIKKLSGDLKRTNIYEPLKDIYDSMETYDKFNLPKNIFLLTDGQINNKEKTLDLIQKNNSKFSVFSIGLGYEFDADLIEKAGILGKGSFKLCKEVENLNSAIVELLGDAMCPFFKNLNVKTNLDEKNLIKGNNIPKILRGNKINLKYITKTKEDLFNIEVSYETLDNQKVEKKYEIKPKEIENGEELSKIIIKDYLINSYNLNEEEKINMELKYQILSNNTSLFAEIELSEKINEVMKLIILGNKNSNLFITPINHGLQLMISRLQKQYEEAYKYDHNIVGGEGFFKESDFILQKIDILKQKEERENKYSLIFNEDNNKGNIDDKTLQKIKLTKEEIMQMIYTQDLIQGFWEENAHTKIIKDNYQKEYDLLKNKNLSDKVIMTIMVVYFVHKEHPELLKELALILRKGKLFIAKETKINYEEIIKDFSI